jgi:hypothetical protein
MSPIASSTLVFDEVVRVAVTPEQISELGLTAMPGKRSDARAGAFMARYGQLVQVEVEAVHPETLRHLYQAAIDERWDKSTYERVCTLEDSERGELEAVLARFEDE